MLHVDWWSWKCARCEFAARNQRGINPHQCVAEAIVSLHKQAHDLADMQSAQPSSVPPAMSDKTRDNIAATTLANLHDELRHERERTRVMAVAWHEALRTVTQLNTVLRRKNRRIARQHQQLKRLEQSLAWLSETRGNTEQSGNS